MSDFQAFVLALVQGVTEFLPVSSSGHLILIPALLGWEDQGLAFDVAVHMGTLVAVVVALWPRLLSMTRHGLAVLGGGPIDQPDAKLAWGVVLATLPVGFAGLLAKDLIEDRLRDPLVIATTTILFGWLLWLSDRYARNQRSLDAMNWRDYLIIGIAQALALIPGTSRSGVTLTAAFALGMERRAAAEFSFLLAVPTVLLSGLVKGYDLANSDALIDWQVLSIGFIVSAVSALVIVKWFLKWIPYISMRWFFLYRVALGLVLFVVFWPT